MEPFRQEDKEITARYQKYLHHNKFLSFSLEPNIFSLYRTGNEEEREYARNEIIKYGLNVAKQFVCKKYNYTSQVNPVFDLDDVFQEATVLILETIDGYDETRGEYSTYLYSVLGSRLFGQKGLASCLVDVSRHANPKYKKMQRALQQNIPYEKIMEVFNIDKNGLEKAKNVLLGYESYEQIARKESLAAEGHPDYYGEDEETKRLLEEECIEIRNKAILNSLNELPLLDKLMIIAYFGLAGNKSISLNQLRQYYPGTGRYIYERYHLILEQLSQNHELAAVVDLVDLDYDHPQENAKKYYLQK